MSIGGGPTRKREGGSGSGRESVQELVRKVREEMAAGVAAPAAGQPGAGGKQEGEEDPCFEVVATVLEIFGRMDSLVSPILAWYLERAGADHSAVIWYRIMRRRRAMHIDDEVAFATRREEITMIIMRG